MYMFHSTCTSVLDINELALSLLDPDFRLPGEELTSVRTYASVSWSSKSKPDLGGNPPFPSTARRCIHTYTI